MLNLNYNFIGGGTKQNRDINGFAPYIYNDPYSASIVAAIPGAVFKEGYDNLFGMNNIWDDVSAYVKGNGVPVGSNRTVTTTGAQSNGIVSASATVWDKYGYPNSIFMPAAAALNAGTDSGFYTGFNITTGSDATANWAAEAWIAIPVSSSFAPPNKTLVYKAESYEFRVSSGTNGNQDPPIFVSPGNTAYSGSFTASLQMDTLAIGGVFESRQIFQTNYGQGAPETGSNNVPAYTWHHIAFSAESNWNGYANYTMYRSFFDGQLQWQEPVNMAGAPPGSEPYYPAYKPTSPAILLGGGQGIVPVSSSALFNDFRFYKGTNKNYTASFDVNTVYPIVIARPY